MILCVDIGGTSAKIACADSDGALYDRDEFPTCIDDYRVPVLDVVCRGIRTWLDRTGRSVKGIGVSAMGQIDIQSGTVIGTNGNVPNYEGARIRETLETQFLVPVRVLNDATAAALGESFTGAAKGLKDVLMLTFGTGVGGGLILNGRVYGGARGIAGELGHFTLDPNGPLCTCGRHGCFETLASTSALVRKCSEATGRTDLDGRAVFAAVSDNNPVITRILDKWMDGIADGISGLIHILNPEIVLIGGGVSVQEALMIRPLENKIRERTMRCFAENLIIRGAKLGNNAGLTGAARYWMDCMQER